MRASNGQRYPSTTRLEILILSKEPMGNFCVRSQALTSFFSEVSHTLTSSVHFLDGACSQSMSCATHQSKFMTKRVKRVLAAHNYPFAGHLLFYHSRVDKTHVCVECLFPTRPPLFPGCRPLRGNTSAPGSPDAREQGRKPSSLALPFNPELNKLRKGFGAGTSQPPSRGLGRSRGNVTLACLGYDFLLLAISLGQRCEKDSKSPASLPFPLHLPPSS